MGISSSGGETVQDGTVSMPDLPPAGGQSVNYGYTPNGMAMPSSMGMPNLNLQAPEFGIVDPTYLAQLAILNQGGGSFMPAAAPAAPMGLLGAGLESQEQFQANAPLLGGAPMIADWRAYSPNRSANADLNRAIAMSQSGGGGDYYGGGGGDLYTYDPQLDAQSGGSRAPEWVGLPADMAHRNFMGDIFGYQDPAPVYNMSTGTTDYANIGNPTAGMGGAYQGSAGSTAATRDMPDGPDGANASSKIVCTAMNEAYGFGSFRNKIWLAYSAKNLTKAHEAGYHALFLPLVSAGYRQDKWYSKPLRAVLENIARHRSADLRAEMRGTKRDRVGQAYRFILEPLCYAVGKLKGN